MLSQILLKKATAKTSRKSLFSLALYPSIHVLFYTYITGYSLSASGLMVTPALGYTMYGYTIRNYNLYNNKSTLNVMMKTLKTLYKYLIKEFRL